MSAVKILLALSFCLVGAYGALPKAQPVLKLPSYVGKGCSRNDPKINECVVRVGAPAIKQVAQGDPKYRIPKLDPLLVDEIKVQQGTRQVGLSLSCKKCLIHGLQNTIFNRAVVNWDKRTCEWYLTLDKMRLTGKYNVSGQVLLLPIVGSGNMEMELKDLTFEYKYDWYYEKRDNGLEYVIIDNSTFPFDVNFMSISLENLFNGDKLLGGNMNRFLNENWRDILKDLRPALSKSLGVELRFINLNNNVIDKIENLEILSKLTIIDLGHNMISKIENLSQLSNLQTLDIANNYIETMEDIEHLKECQSLRNIDLAHNSITDPNAVEIFANMGSLKTLSLIGNPLIGKIRNYRRTMILKCKRLTALDERLIKTVERKATEAWAVGGVEAEKNVYEEDFENKRKYRKELVDDLMRNRIIIREKARAKWKKKKCKNLDHGDFENIPSEEDSFYPDLLGSEDSSLSLSGTEDLYEDLWYSEPKCEGSSSKNKKQRLIFTLPSCDITTSGEECGINHTTQDEGPSKEIDKCCRYALNDDEEISNHPLSISENKNIVKTNSKTCFNIHELHNNEEDTIKTTDQHDINEYKLDKMLSREQLDQYSSDENEFFHPAFQETEIDETKVNKLFEELFLSDKDEAFNERDKNSFSEKSMQSDIQDLLKDKKPNYDNSESNIAEAPQRAKDNKYYLKNEIKDQNKSHYEQYQDMLCILNSVKQKDIMNDEMTKTNTLHHVSEIIQNHIENNYRSDITKEQEMNPSTEDSSTIEGMEEYRIRRGEEKLEQLCQTPFPYIKDKKSSMKRNLKQAKTLFLQLFK